VLFCQGFPQRQPFPTRLGDFARDEPNGADGIVIGGDGKVRHVGVAIGVHDGDDRDAQFAGKVSSFSNCLRNRTLSFLGKTSINPLRSISRSSFR
jgi:hypothetical protein